MKTEEFLNHPVSTVTGCREVEGNKFGIELELEGRNVAMHDVATRGWQRHADGSLRGEAIEYVTSGGGDLAETRKRVLDLFKKFKDNGVKFNESIRTSTHVHLNFSDKTLKSAINFFALFTMLEEVLQYYSGEDRKGNLFCISTREAEGIVGILADCIGKADLSRFAGDRFKYSACNLSTLYKFGTIEVRTMRGASSAEQVMSWVDLLNDMYEYAQKMTSPVELVTDLSVLGAEGLMKKIFKPENYKELMQYFPKIITLHYSLMEGARLIQIFAYEFEAAFVAKVEIKKKEKPGGKIKGGGRIVGGDGNGGPLHNQIPAGALRGSHYMVYRPNGDGWHVAKSIPGLVWEDGEAVSDSRNMHWSQDIGRFYWQYDNGDTLPLNWGRHEVFGNEGPPALLYRLDRKVRLFDDEDENEDNEEEGNWDFDEVHDEGDDF